MADLFLSYARADAARAALIAAAAEQDGRTLWWDRRLAGGGDYGMVIEREIAEARCVIVGWSRAARDSLWVRAEANEALDQGKLAQVNFDGAKPPLPFNMLHFLDFSGWGGAGDEGPWQALRAQCDRAIDGATGSGGRRPDPGGIMLAGQRSPPLQGFGAVAAIGWTALAVAVILGLATLLVVQRFITAEAYAAISIGGAAIALLALAASAFLLLKIGVRSRA